LRWRDDGADIKTQFLRPDRLRSLDALAGDEGLGGVLDDDIFFQQLEQLISHLGVREYGVLGGSWGECFPFCGVLLGFKKLGVLCVVLYIEELRRSGVKV